MTIPTLAFAKACGSGAPTLADMGGSFGIVTGGVLTLFMAAPPNGSSVWVRVQAAYPRLAT